MSVLTEIGKLCSRCGEDKPLTDFSPQAKCAGGVKPECKACSVIRERERRAARSADEVREKRGYYLMRRFGITVDDYDRMLAEQDGRCAICGTDDPGDPRGYTFPVDHDHATGEVRALLCVPCNHGLGKFGDDPNRLLAAAAYLLSRTDVLGEVK